LRNSGDDFSYFLSKFQNFLGRELPAKKYAVESPPPHEFMALHSVGKLYFLRLRILPGFSGKLANQRILKYPALGRKDILHYQPADDTASYCVSGEHFHFI
jgi:hypothetical protein